MEQACDSLLILNSCLAAMKKAADELINSLCIFQILDGVFHVWDCRGCCQAKCGSGHAGRVEKAGIPGV